MAELFHKIALFVSNIAGAPYTIVTFLMIFLIQNTQNRDSKTMQIKLD